MRRAIKKERSDSDCRGAVMVELALMLPLFITMLLGIINLGLAVREHQVLQNAAREGARFSSLPGNRMDISDTPLNRSNDIADRVVSYLSLHFPDISRGTGTAIIAKRKYDYPINIGGSQVGNLVIDQGIGIVIDPATSPVTMVSASEVTLTYNRALLIPGAPFLPFNNVTLTGTSVFKNLY